jgi:hypothetical protein
MDAESIIAATREELLQSLTRWRLQARELSNYPTLRTGVALTALRLVESLLSQTIAGLLPHAPLPPKPTLGQLVGAIEQFGMKESMVCLERPRKLVTRTDMSILNRLTGGRNSVTHLRSGEDLAEKIGRLDSSDVARIMEIAEAIAHLPLIDEVLCREQKLRVGRFDRDAQLQLWLTTVISIEVAGRSVDVDAVLPGELARVLAPLTLPICVLTAFNPDGRTASRDINEVADAALRKELQSRQIAWLPAIGRAPGSDEGEPSFAFSVSSLEEASEWAAAWNQRAVFVVTEDEVHVVPDGGPPLRRPRQNQ